MKKIDSRVFKWAAIILVSLFLSWMFTPLDSTLLFRLVLTSVLLVLTWLVVTVMGKIPIKIRKIVVAFVICFSLAAFASSWTATGSCGPDGAIAYGEPGDTSCSAFWRESPSANEFIHNKHNSLVNFTETFVISALISFGILELFARNKKRRSKKEK